MGCLKLHTEKKYTVLKVVYRKNAVEKTTNATGKLVEQRRFDAWGNIEEVRHFNAAGTSFTTDKILLTLDRGYTGHEHLQNVGLIHMNGRVYDPLLRRFLGPDNFVQDPFNTQNFNRFGYVLNNPLMYTDPSGEFIEAFLIGMAINIFFNGINNMMNGNPFWWGMGKAGLVGALSGGISSGIGSISQIFVSPFTQALFQAGAHGATSGLMNMANGGEFGNGFYTGVVSSAVTSVVGIGLMYKDPTGELLKSPLGKAAMIAAGGVSGGLTAWIVGDNIWRGVAQGLIISVLNHSFHEIAGGWFSPKNGYDEQGNKINDNGGDETDYIYDKESNEIASTKVKHLGKVEGSNLTYEKYGLRIHDKINLQDGPLYDPSFDIASTFFGGGLAKGSLSLVMKTFSKVKLFSNYSKNGVTLFKYDKNFRIDFDFKNGLHYHRRGPGGIGRHRPWQQKPGDNGDFWKRF